MSMTNNVLYTIQLTTNFMTMDSNYRMVNPDAMFRLPTSTTITSLRSSPCPVRTRAMRLGPVEWGLTVVRSISDNRPHQL